MFEILTLIGIYLSSTLIILVLNYFYKKTITYQDIFVSLIPIINTLAIIFGITKAISNWYAKNKNKVLIQRRPSVKKPRAKVVKPKPKIKKDTTLPSVESFQIPAPK